MSKHCSLIFIGVPDSDKAAYESALKSFRMPVESVWINSEAELTEQLQERLWDLILYDDQAALQSRDIRQLIKARNRDIPWILIGSDNSPEYMREGLLQQASAVIPRHQPELLMLVIRRELYHLENRKRRRQAEFHLLELEKQQRQLIESSTLALAYLNREFKFLFANPAFLQSLGYSQLAQLQGKTLLDITVTEQQRQLRQRHQDYLASPEEPLQLSLSLLNAQQRAVNATLQLSRSRFERTPCTLLQLETEQAVSSHTASLNQEDDLVSGLKSKIYLNTHLDEAILAASKQETALAQLIYLRIVQHELIKVESGTGGVDNCIRMLAEHLRAQVPDHHILARYGTDAFAILMRDSSSDEALQMAEQLQQSLADLSTANDELFDLSCSISIAQIDAETISTQALLKDVRQALQPNCIHVCQTAQQKQAQGISISMLRDAIENNQLKLLFQPMVGLHGHGEHIYEVLFRLVDGAANELSPSLFMAMLDHAELSTEIDRWVVAESIRQLATSAGKDDNLLFININSRTLADESFQAWLADQLQALGINGKQLVFQISEQDATENIKQANLFVQSLQQFSAQACIKHYGSSIDSESVLRHVPTRYIKLDGSFIRELHDKSKHEAFDKLLEPLKNDHKTIIAPLVENTHPMSKLWSSGIHFVQGFYLQAPRERMDYDFFG